MNIRSIARKPFTDIFFSNPVMPSFLRLALSDSLSYEPSNNTGGSINNYNDIKFCKLQQNKKLRGFYKMIKEVQEHGNHLTNDLSLPDLIQLAGATSVEYCGGPYIEVG